jgi:hypothetical protein
MVKGFLLATEGYDWRAEVSQSPSGASKTCYNTQKSNQIDICSHFLTNKICNSEIERTLPRIVGIRTQINDWCYSSATTGQLWVSLLTACDSLSLLTPLFIITDRLMCTRVIAHFLTFKRLAKLYVTNRL